MEMLHLRTVGDSALAQYFGTAELDAEVLRA